MKGIDSENIKIMLGLHSL